MALQSPVQPDRSGNAMKREGNRLLSYKNWPVKYINPNTLAKAGFYFTEEGDSVQCAFCNIVLNRWQEGDNPMADHRKWAPNCPFVQGGDGRDVSNALDRAPIAKDAFGRFSFQIMLNSLPEQETPSLPSGLPYNGGPFYKEYSSLQQRLTSFKNWPTDNPLTPDQLATAGFFYPGIGDRTVCFYCRGGLNNWEDGDDGWEQHAHWFPKCSFLLMQKGQRFVSEVHNKLGDAVLSHAEAASLEVSDDLRKRLKVAETPVADNEKRSNCTKCKMCKICYSEEIKIAFIPCGHLVACIDCGLALTVCPFCRESINATLRVFPL